MGDSFYKSKRWERLRKSILARDGYKCQVSKRYGKNVPANTVHHALPASEFPQYKWEPWNLVAVSGEVHDKLHDRNNGELTEAGRDLARRIARREGIDIDY